MYMYTGSRVKWGKCVNGVSASLKIFSPAIFPKETEFHTQVHSNMLKIFIYTNCSLNQYLGDGIVFNKAYKKLHPSNSWLCFCELFLEGKIHSEFNFFHRIHFSVTSVTMTSLYFIKVIVNPEICGNTQNNRKNIDTG